LTQSSGITVYDDGHAGCYLMHHLYLSGLCIEMIRKWKPLAMSKPFEIEHADYLDTSVELALCERLNCTLRTESATS